MTPEKLKKFRKNFGLSQFDVADKTKVSRYNISLFETGHRKLTDQERGKLEALIDKETKNAQVTKRNQK